MSNEERLRNQLVADLAVTRIALQAVMALVAVQNGNASGTLRELGKSIMASIDAMPISGGTAEQAIQAKAFLKARGEHFVQMLDVSEDLTGHA